MASDADIGPSTHTKPRSRVNTEGPPAINTTNKDPENTAKISENEREGWNNSRVQEDPSLRQSQARLEKAVERDLRLIEDVRQKLQAQPDQTAEIKEWLSELGKFSNLLFIQA